MKKTIWNLSFTVLTIICNSNALIAQQLQNMFYCNASGDILNIWLLGNRGFIGHTIAGNSNYLILFSNERVATDTLDIGDNTGHFLQSLVVLNDSVIQYNTLNNTVTCKVINNQWQLLQSVARKDFGNATTSNCGHYYNFQDIELWFTCHDYSKKKLQALAYYRKNGRTGKIIDLQIDDIIPKKAYKGSSHIDAEIMYNMTAGIIYIALETAGRFAVFNTHTLQTQVYNFPVADYTSESYRLYYDYLQDKLYAVNYRKQDTDRVFRLSQNYELIPVREISDKVEGVINGHLHIIKEDKDKTVCHYLIPILGEAPPFRLLENVPVNKKQK